MHVAATLQFRVALAELRGDLREGLCRGDADGHRDGCLSPALPGDLLGVLVEVHVHPIQVQERFVNRVDLDGRGVAPEHLLHPSRHVAVQREIPGKHVDMVLLHDVPYLEEWIAHLDAERLGLVAPGHRAAIVVREHDDRLPVQLRTEDPFARGEEIVAVGKGIHGLFLLLKKLRDHQVPVVDHHLGDPVALRLLVIQVPDALLVESDDIRTGHGQKDGRVSDDDVLRTLPCHLSDPGEKGELALRGERSLGLVHDEKPRPGKSPDEAQETLTVGLFMERPVPVHRTAQFLLVFNSLGGDVVETLGTEEESAASSLCCPLGDCQRIAQLGVVVVRGEVVVQRPTLGIEPVGDRDGLQQRRFPGTILTHKERHGLAEGELLQQADRGDPRQVAVRAHLVPVYAYAVDVHDGWEVSSQGL